MNQKTKDVPADLHWLHTDNSHKPQIEPILVWYFCIVIFFVITVFEVIFLFYCWSVRMFYTLDFIKLLVHKYIINVYFRIRI